MATQTTFDLFTKVLDPAHVPLIEDWLDFLPESPACLHIYAPDSPEIDRALKDLTNRRDLPLVLHTAKEHEDLKHCETPILERFFDASTAQYAYLVNLDTLPFRQGEDDWFDSVEKTLNKGNFAFFSTTGLGFRADQAIADDPDFVRTQRFSNNHALISVALWKEIMSLYPMANLAGQPEERWHSEWAIESWCRDTGRYGLRRRDTDTWRVFHVQQWDARLFETRDRFRAGVGVRPFLNRVYEDTHHPWEKYYGFPKPSLLRRLRIELGRIRRKILRKD